MTILIYEIVDAFKLGLTTSGLSRLLSVHLYLTMDLSAILQRNLNLVMSAQTQNIVSQQQQRNSLFLVKLLIQRPTIYHSHKREP